MGNYTHSTRSIFPAFLAKFFASSWLLLLPLLLWLFRVCCWVVAGFVVPANFTQVVANARHHNNNKSNGQARTLSRIKLVEYSYNRRSNSEIFGELKSMKKVTKGCQ